VPVLVRDVPDEAAAAMALIENMQREDLNPLEEARGVQRLTEEFGLTHEAAARAIGRSRSATTNLLRLLQLSEPVQQLLLGGAIEMGHARALLPLGGAEQIQAANEIVAKGMNVAKPEKLAARRAAGSARQTPLLRAKRQKSSDILRLERQLSDTFAATVEIRLRDSGPARGIAAKSRSPSPRSTSSTGCSASSATSGPDPPACGWCSRHKRQETLHAA
jgi:ParB family chromosome partitioning protein